MRRTILYLGIALLIFASAAQAASNAARHQNVGKDRLAIGGYDPVSYFSGKPVRGNTSITTEHDGAIYRFASEDNRNAFTAQPAKYAPAYGGWCATAMAENKKVAIDPLNYKVTNGRLFLFYRSVFADGLKKWLKNEAGLTVKADGYWTKLIS
jgi:YHS domain-containing protein